MLQLTVQLLIRFESSQRSLNEVGSRSRLHLAVTQQARYNMYPAAAQNARYISKSKNSLYDVEEAPAMGLGSSYEGLSMSSYIFSSNKNQVYVIRIKTSWSPLISIVLLLQILRHTLK